MFGVLAKTYFRATGFPARQHPDATRRSYFEQDLIARNGPKRWEDWK